MKRRITLFLTTLGLLLIGFSLYWLIADTPDNPIIEKMDYLRTDKDGSSATTEPVRQGLLIFTRDKEGRLEGIYRAPDWNREEDGSYTLKDPSVERYQKDGRAFFIRADEGQFIVEEVAGGMNPRRGWLKGNVRITLDLASGSNLSPPEDRPEDCIRIYVDHIRFNNDELEISSDSHVTVFSPDADVLGKGLVIRWNDNPQELRVLKILEGEQMTLRRIPAGLEVAMVSPSDLTSGETTSAGAKAVPEKTPLEKIAMLPSILKEALAATQPAQSEEPVETAATLATATEPASQPDRDEKTPRRNIFLATFSDNIKVRSTQGTLSGADRISLAFEWDSQNYSGLGRRGETDRPSDSAPSETKPASPEGPMQQLVLTWTGPLTIEPLGYTPTPAADRYHVDIEGPNIVLADDRSETFCSRLVYSNVYQAGLVLGRAERPVTMQLSETEKIICPEVRFDRGKGLVALVGAGQILSGKEELSAAIEPVIPGDSITWQGSVLARLSEAQVRDKDGNTQTRPSISEALFRDKVDLRSSKPGDFVQCDQLHVWLEEGANGPYPARAEASGNVKASQDGSDISAQMVAINFEESKEKNATGETKYKFNPTTLVASGSVTIVNDDGEKTTSAFADRLSANVSKNLAVLEGKPARIVQGDYSIQGARIAFDQNNQAAQVLGEGELSILTDRNFSGEKLDQARPVRIGWEESMQFDGVSRQADFLGGVKLNSELNSIQCDRMRATFVGVEDETASEPSNPSGTMDLNMNRFGKLRLATVLSIGKVTVRSAQLDDEGKLLRRVKLTGEKLLYDAENGQIDSFGHGELLAEDYRPPEPAKEEKNSDDQLSGGVERPWQTAFVWNNQMQYSQKNRSVVMDGDVGMIHRSGNKVLGTEGLNVPDWPGLKDGRTMGLSCGKLVARFDDPDNAGTDSKDMDPESRVGRLRLFSATRDVNLTDGQYRLVGQRLIYHRTEGLAVLWGFLEGQPETRAYVYEENPLTHRVRSISSPKIHCFLQDGYIRKVETANVQGGGAR